MFNVDELIAGIKRTYTVDITIAHSDRIAGILDRNKNLEFYSLDKLMEYADVTWQTPSNPLGIPFVIILRSSYAGDSSHIKNFEKLLTNGKRNFSWFMSWYNSTSVTGMKLITICPDEQEEKIYNKLLKFENLKVFI